MTPGAARGRVHAESHVNAEGQHDARSELCGGSTGENGVGPILDIGTRRLLLSGGGARQQERESAERGALYRARARHRAYV